MDYFFEHVSKALVIYNQKYDKFLLCGDFNSQHTNSSLSELLLKYDCKNLVMKKTCFKNPENSRCIDLFLNLEFPKYFPFSLWYIWLS